MTQKFIFRTLIALTVVSCVAQEPTHGKHWLLTDSETLWRGRYGNCDYGYFVTLTEGVVGHDNLPPAPNHGFSVALPDPKSDKPFPEQESRYLWVDASYNVLDSNSLEDVARTETRLLDETFKSKTVGRRPTSLEGVRAVRASVLSGAGPEATVVESVIALRGGIVYSIGLKTTTQNRMADEKAFRNLVSGFHFSRIPIGECGND